MPSKKKKYNARFPAGRIKKIMQTDEEVGKVAQAVPVIISRTLELFVGSLLTKAMQITSAKNAKTLSPSHMKQCILSEKRFDFLTDLVKSVQDSANGEDETAGAMTAQPYPMSVIRVPNKSLSERRRSNSSLKEEQPAIKEEPNVVKPEHATREEIAVKHAEHDVKEEIVVKENSMIKEEMITHSPEEKANCSTLHLSPNFYMERTPEQRVTPHQPSLIGVYHQLSQPPYQEPSRISTSPILIMDEDYDT